jgi:endogenous inhibitor of DNA gyrase (YacG/DUF329 family)
MAALSAYLGTRNCPECGIPIDQSESEGRDRIYDRNACKQKAYRRKKTQCPECEAPNALTPHPYTGQIVQCYKCGAKVRYDYIPNARKSRGWTTIKEGKKQFRKP